MLIAIAVVIIGGTGWYVWHSKNQTNKILDQAANEKTAAPTKKVIAASNGYLVVKEWGVRMKLPAELDAVYIYDGSKNAGYGRGAVQLSTQTLRRMFPGCEFAAIMRADGKDIYDPDSAFPSMTVAEATTAIGGIKHVGNYYYRYQSAEGVYCTGPNSPREGGVQVMSNQEMKARNAMNTAFDALEAIHQ